MLAGLYCSFLTMGSAPGYENQGVHVLFVLHLEKLGLCEQVHVYTARKECDNLRGIASFL